MDAWAGRDEIVRNWTINCCIEHAGLGHRPPQTGAHQRIAIGRLPGEVAAHISPMTKGT